MDLINETISPSAIDRIVMALLTDTPVQGLGEFIHPRLHAGYALTLYHWLREAPIGGQQNYSRINRDTDSCFQGALLCAVISQGNWAKILTVKPAINGDWEDITLGFWTSYLREGASCLPANDPG